MRASERDMDDARERVKLLVSQVEEADGIWIRTDKQIWKLYIYLYLSDPSGLFKPSIPTPTSRLLTFG